MAKAATTVKDQNKPVPAAEMVGDHANKQASGAEIVVKTTVNTSGITQEAAEKLKAAILGVSDTSLQPFPADVSLQPVDGTKTAILADDQSRADLLHAAVADGSHPQPLIGAALVKFYDEHGHLDVAAVRITTKQEGFRRGGMRHSGTVNHPVKAFNAEQMEQLLAEPLLIVELLDAEATD